MTIVFNSNHFNTIIYTKYNCVPSFNLNKPSVNDFKRVIPKKALKTLKMQRRTLFEAYDYCFKF